MNAIICRKCNAEIGGSKGVYKCQVCGYTITNQDISNLLSDAYDKYHGIENDCKSYRVYNGPVTEV